MAIGKLDLSPICMRARGFIGQGRIDDALGLYGDVIEIDPANALAYADRGTAYAMVKKFDLALSDLERALVLGYEHSSAYGTLATVHFEMKQFQKAVDLFGKAIDLDPGNAIAYYNRSNALYELGEVEAAIADLEKCLELEPQDDFRLLINRRLEFLRRQP